MDELLRDLERFKALPRFPDGRIDYTFSDIAPVLSIFVRFNDDFLLLKRSDKVGNYKGKWNVVAGYLDEPKSVESKTLDEFKEELGIEESMIESISFGKRYEIQDKFLKKSFIVYPVMISLKEKPSIKLDFEHTEFRWIKLSELKDYDTIPDLENSLEHLKDFLPKTMQTKDSAKFHIVAAKGWIEKDGKFLLAKRGPNEVHDPNVWSLPGGKVEESGEDRDTIEKTLKREIMEEVGLEIQDDIEFVYDNCFIRSDGAHVVMMTFLCGYKSGEARPLEDTSEVRWLTLDELKSFKEAKEFLKIEIERLENHLAEK